MGYFGIGTSMTLFHHCAAFIAEQRFVANDVGEVLK